MRKLGRFSVLVFVLSFLLPWGVQIAHAEDENTYVVKSGDTLTKIAMRYEVGVAELATANDLRWDNWVYVGQHLTIPRGEATRDIVLPDSVDRSAFVVDLRVPNPRPELPVLSQERSEPSRDDTYARVVQEGAPVYGHPADAALGMPPLRTLGAGFVWVTVHGHVDYEGRDYYLINPGEYVLADALSFYTPSAFQGVALAQHPERPFAWILQTVQPSLTPAGDLNAAAPAYHRYDLVQIFGAEHIEDQVWYLIGEDQWINQIYVGKVAPSARPAGVEPGAAWVEVDLFEQTLAAYEGDRMVYATLISSGLRGWDTPPGLFQVWLKVAVGKMSGADNRPDYYFLEDVPWTMYFNQDVALHTAYWHDGFGYRHSHGCVNLPPADAHWLFDWAPDGLWVWVH
jgi:hypothetical protein